MRSLLACIPCFVRQAVDAVSMVTKDESVREKVIREVLRAAAEMDLSQSPPAMAQWIHRLIRDTTGNSDPYRDVKRQFNRLALGLYSGLKARIEESPDPLDTAVRIAIAGNVIDFGPGTDVTERDVHEAIRHALASSLNGAVAELADAVSHAGSILYLADNAGEIVFDRLLIERLPLEKVTVCVRGRPVLNDATLIDAETAGLTKLAEVIDNGSDAPGTILEDCDEGFRRRFDQADLVLAKGQGNYETLSDVDKSIFFLFKAKCAAVADKLGCHVGSLVVRRLAGETTGKR